MITAISSYNRFKYDETLRLRHDWCGPASSRAIQETYKQFSQENPHTSPKRGGLFEVIAGGFFQWSPRRICGPNQHRRGLAARASGLQPGLCGGLSSRPSRRSLAANPGDVPGAVAAGRAAGNQAGAAGLALADTRSARERRVVTTNLWSAFGQLTWNATPKVHVNVGGRLNYEKKKGRRNLEVQAIDGSALTGLQALVGAAR